MKVFVLEFQYAGDTTILDVFYSAGSAICGMRRHFERIKDGRHPSPTLESWDYQPRANTSAVNICAIGRARMMNKNGYEAVYVLSERPIKGSPLEALAAQAE